MKSTFSLSILRLFLNVAFFLFSILYAKESKAQYLQTNVLYANGHKEYSADNWVYASVYLFAYIQRNPAEFNDKIYKNEVIAAFDFSVQQLNSQAEELKRLIAKQKQMEQNQNGIGSVTQGLTGPKPVLRKPTVSSTVSDVKH